jgi:hypothetical protein
MSVRDRVREWLWGEESRALRGLDAKLDFLTRVSEQSNAHEATLLREVEKLAARIAAAEETTLGQMERNLDFLSASVQASRLAEKLHSGERADQIEMLAQMLGPIEEAQTRLLLLLEPKAGRLRQARPPIGDWDSVVQDNMKNFEESSDGKPVR